MAAERRICTIHAHQPCPRGSAYLHYYATEMTIPARDIERGDMAPLGDFGAMNSVCALRKDDSGVHLASALDVAFDRFREPIPANAVITIWRTDRSPRKR